MAWSLAPLGLGALWFFLVHAPAVRATADRHWLDELAFRADLRRATIEDGLHEALADARLVAAFPTSRELGCATAGLKDGEEIGHLEGVLRTVLREDELDALVLIAPGGAAVTRVGAAAGLEDDPVVRTALAGDEAIDLRPATAASEARIMVAVPIPCGDGAPPASFGVIIAVLDGRRWLFPVLRSSTVPEATSLESLVVVPEGDRILFVTPLRFRPGRGIGLSLPRDSEDLAAAHALAGEESEDRFLDYRGVPVLAAVRQIRPTGWGLVVKLDLREARRPVGQRLLTEGLVGGLAVASAGLAAGTLLLYRRRSSEARAASERARFATALDEANDAILFLTSEGRIADANRRAEHLYGRPRAELLGLDMAALSDGSSSADLRTIFRLLREKGELLFEAVHRRTGDGAFPVEVSARWIGTGGEAEILAIVRDVSEMRQAEESFRRLFANSPFPSWIFDLETLRFAEVNDAAVALYGWSREEFLAMTIADIRPPETVPVLEQRLVELRERPRDLHGARWAHRRKDGSRLEVEVYSYAHTLQGRAARVVMVHDVTARDRAERELRKLTRAVEQSSASVVITDLAGTIEYVNSRFCAISGFSREEAIGQNPRILKSGLTPAETYRQMWAALAAGRIWEGELCNRRKDGSLYWEEASISPLVDGDGRVSHFVAVKEDVTARRRLAAELEQAQRLESIGRLAGGVAHDINNILAVIGGITEQVLGELPAAASLRADLLEVSAAVERGAALTTKLLTFGRRRPADPRPLDLRSLISDVGTMLGRLLAEQIELVLDLPQRVAAVRADPAGIEQVLMNLALNARDAMPDGGRLTIALTERRLEADGDGSTSGLGPGHYVELSVADTGAGIPEAVRDHLFEPFVTTKELGAGTGLGLAVVHGIVAQAHGAIRVESAPDRGTVFRILLPCADEPVPASTPPRRPAATPGAAGETVLLAEDDRAVRSLVERMLRAGGYRVLAAASGEAALALLASEPGPIALLVTDVGMPGMRGDELARRVREERPHTPVLVISGHLAEQSGEGTGFGDSFLAKPFDAKALLAAARATIEAAAGRA